MLAPVPKIFSYLSLQTMADWLKIDSNVVNIGATAATLTVQDLKYTSILLLGAEGNALSIEYLSGGTAGSEQVTYKAGLISVKIEDGVSTADQIKTAVENSIDASRFVSVTVTGTGSNAQSIAASAPFTAGANAAKYDARTYRVLIAVMDAACDWFENAIDGPVLTRQFTGYYDGSNSNVVRPQHWPVRTIKSIKIDYNRQFPADSELNASQFFLRGAEDAYQVKGSAQLEIVGSDVVLRDDNETFIVGRIFSGSILGSIELVYTAGLGETPDDLPADLMHATIQLAEYWFYQRENRDVAVSSKGVRGESYTKLKGDVPDEIQSVAQSYTDMSFGNCPVPQRNYFRT